MSPKIYVVAGPNGIGKTTTTFDGLPRNIPIINSDEIASLMRSAGITQTNVQELSNREAVNLMNQYLNRKETFAVETNLADLDTWKFLSGIQKSGYQVILFYLSTDHIDLLNSRIEQRALTGEHYVRPDIVEERYINSLSLLNHYLPLPEVVFLYDNSTSLRIVAEIQKGKIISVEESLPKWVTHYLPNHFSKSPGTEKKSIADMNSLDEVRKAYENLKNPETDNSSENITGKNESRETKKGKSPRL